MRIPSLHPVLRFLRTDLYGSFALLCRILDYTMHKISDWTGRTLQICRSQQFKHCIASRCGSTTTSFGYTVFSYTILFQIIFLALSNRALAAEEGPKAGGLAALGIDPLALLFQLVNFGILFFILARFVYPPLVKLFEDRRQKIEKALEDAEVTQKLRAKAENERQAVLNEAKAQARKMISDATAAAQDRSREMLAEAELKSKAIVARAEADSRAQGAKLRVELRNELRNLVTAATAKVLAGVIDKDIDAKLVDKAISGVQK